MTEKMPLNLIKWYKINQRKLPWRETTNPYFIWLSEIMLQQTKVDTVIPYYLKFCKSYPSVDDLAKAQMDDVLKLWEGLGYYSRAKRLIPCAKMLVEDYRSTFPSNKEALLSLPGIGSYTAGAILGIAFNQKEPAVDGNVLRVVSRLDRMKEDITKQKTRVLVEEKLRSILPKDMRSFNQAMMELGALVCTPKNPTCEICPIKESCSAYEVGDILEYPVKTKKTKAVMKDVLVAVIEFEGKYLMYQKEPTGLIGGFWAFPHQVENESQKQLTEVEDVYETFNYQLNEGYEIGKTKHVFSHQVWNMTVIKYEVNEYFYVDEPKMKWVSLIEMESLPITRVMKRVINLI
jgi:A/G-specific adenine glycosylase